MDFSAFAVDFFDNVLWENKLEYARRHPKGLFWGIFKSCTEQHNSIHMFVFTLRQWRKLLSFITPDEKDEIKAQLQISLTVQAANNRFYKDINLCFYCVIVLDETVKIRIARTSVFKNKIKVELMKQREGKADYFLSNDLFENYAAEDRLYADMNIDDFLRQNLRSKIGVPKKHGWLYYFSSQEHPVNDKRGIVYCPAETKCPWIDFLNRCKGI